MPVQIGAQVPFLIITYAAIGNVGDNALLDTYSHTL